MTKPSLTTAGLSLAVLALAALAPIGPAALEISLEENKAQRGNIGFVDLQKVFRLFPETHKAKQSYREIVRQAEEQINLRKAGMMTLRTEIAQLKAEKALLEKTPAPERPAAPPPKPPPPEEVDDTFSTPPAEALPAPATGQAPVEGAVPAEGALPEGTTSQPGSPAAAGTAVSTAAAAVEEPIEALPGMSDLAKEAKPAAAEPGTEAEPLVINIPGVSEKPIVVEPPPAPPAGGTPAPADAEPVPEPPAPSASDAAYAAALAEYEEKTLERERRLKELDSRIAEKETELGKREAEFKTYQGQVEKNLIDIENRRSEILLGKIYQAVRQVARENGVSVVVDKNQILFGQGTVDLTNKVIRKLEE